MSLQLPEPPTVSASAELLVTVISLVDSLEVVQQLVMEKGRELVEGLIKAVGMNAPRSQLQFYTNILHALCLHCISPLSQWLEVQHT